MDPAGADDGDGSIKRDPAPQRRPASGRRRLATSRSRPARQKQVNLAPRRRRIRLQVVKDVNVR